MIKRTLLRKRCLLLCLLLLTKNTFGWVYPEHRRIAILAVQNLSPLYRAQLEELWSLARKGYEKRLTTYSIDSSHGQHLLQLDYASWTAIAGDHSCSPKNLLFNVLNTDWIIKVADVAAELNSDITAAGTKIQIQNALRKSDIRLLDADEEYATRAGTNNVHFLLARASAGSALTNYLESCLTKGAPLNALGVYAWYHTIALHKIAAGNNVNLNAQEKSAMVLAALADEAFALHFLEDAFAAGHIAGTWGDESLRKGTHDYYNEHGLEIVSWNGTRMVHMGDAYMTEKDADEAMSAVALSLKQLLDVAAHKLNTNDSTNSTVLILPDSFNVCTNNFMPGGRYNLALLHEIFIKTPVPALATGTGELPRFRAEIGPFIGLSASTNGSRVFGGFGENQKAYGLQGSLEANIRFGLGLDGVLSQAGAGLSYLQIGWRQDGASSNKTNAANPSLTANSITSAIPARFGFNLRLRAPFWLIPGDLLLSAPILLLTSPKTLKNMAVTAVNGGLIPWQSGIATKYGRVQFVLGREIGLSFYGWNNANDVIIVSSGNDFVIVNYKSVKLDFPIIEFRPVHSFTQNQTTSLLIQLNAGVDLPRRVKLIDPQQGELPKLGSVWYIGLRLLFDWRHYF